MTTKTKRKKKPITKVCEDLWRDYVKLRDGAIAYYNGTDQFLMWIERLTFSFHFFMTLSKEYLEDLKRDGVTHLCVRGKLPPSNLWTKVYCSPQYCLYQLKGD